MHVDKDELFLAVMTQTFGIFEYHKQSLGEVLAHKDQSRYSTFNLPIDTEAEISVHCLHMGFTVRK